jgi:hypothetical protein
MGQQATPSALFFRTSDFLRIFSKYTPARPEQQQAASVAAKPTVKSTFGCASCAREQT